MGCKFLFIIKRILHLGMAQIISELLGDQSLHALDSDPHGIRGRLAPSRFCLISLPLPVPEHVGVKLTVVCWVVPLDVTVARLSLRGPHAVQCDTTCVAHVVCVAAARRTLGNIVAVPASSTS